jgi:hypothetical protein
LSRVIGKPVDPHNPQHAGTLWIVEDITTTAGVTTSTPPSKAEARSSSAIEPSRPTRNSTTATASPTNLVCICPTPDEYRDEAA